MRVAEWVDLGRRAILQLLDLEHAAVWLEIEAKIADKVWQPLGMRVQPHHLTTARQELRAEGQIIETAASTRGGAEITVLHLANLQRRKSTYRRAAARKRLLHTRYVRWAVRLGLLGPAGEKVAHASLHDVAPAVGYRLERPEGGDVSDLFGSPIPGGPLDGTAHLQLTDVRGIGVGVVTVPIEVKNVREWIYPDSERLHQLLYKAARLQMAFPDVPIVPVLVCRRGAYQTFKMAKAFGFYVADAKAQFVPRREDVRPTHVEELRSELGFSDLVQDEGPHRLLRSHFGRSLPRVASSAAQTWANIGSAYVEEFERLRLTSISRGERAALADGLEQAVKEILGEVPEPEEMEESYPPDYDF